jgi:hypothetical protein
VDVLSLVKEVVTTAKVVLVEAVVVVIVVLILVVAVAVPVTVVVVVAQVVNSSGCNSGSGRSSSRSGLCYRFYFNKPLTGYTSTTTTAITTTTTTTTFLTVGAVRLGFSITISDTITIVIHLLHENCRKIADSSNPWCTGPIGRKVDGMKRVHSSLQLSTLIGEHIIPNIVKFYTLFVYGFYNALLVYAVTGGKELVKNIIIVNEKST